MKLSLQTKIIVAESIVATILIAALFSDYENNIYLRQYLGQALGGFQANISLQSIARLGNFLLIPLRVLTLTLLSLMTLILLLPLLFMFCTFILSMMRQVYTTFVTLSLSSNSRGHNNEERECSSYDQACHGHRQKFSMKMPRTVVSREMSFS